MNSWSRRDPARLPVPMLVEGVIELLDAGAEYYTSVQTIITIAVTSEALFTRFYERWVRREGDPPAPTFLLGFDSTPIRAEKSLYDLVGGPLSHSSIVAREYGIPAVLGTAVATRRLFDGAVVHVDGAAGTVTLLEEAAAGTAPQGGAGPQRGGPRVASAALAGLALAIVWSRRRRAARRRGR